MNRRRGTSTTHTTARQAHSRTMQLSAQHGRRTKRQASRYEISRKSPKVLHPQPDSLASPPMPSRGQTMPGRTVSSFASGVPIRLSRSDKRQPHSSTAWGKAGSQRPRSMRQPVPRGYCSSFSPVIEAFRTSRLFRPFRSVPRTPYSQLKHCRRKNIGIEPDQPLRQDPFCACIQTHGRHTPESVAARLAINVSVQPPSTLERHRVPTETNDVKLVSDFNLTNGSLYAGCGSRNP